MDAKFGYSNTTCIRYGFYSRESTIANATRLSVQMVENSLWEPRN